MSRKSAFKEQNCLNRRTSGVIEFVLLVLNLKLLCAFHILLLHMESVSNGRLPYYNVQRKNAGRYNSVGSDVAWDQEAPRSILASGTSFREDLVMKLFLRPFFLFR